MNEEELLKKLAEAKEDEEKVPGEEVGACGE